jgi:CheY-like chemotaxis protein/predicted transcriptional regulator
MGSFSVAVIERMLRVLYEHSPGINRTNLAGKTGLNYGTCIRYVDLLLILKWVNISQEYGGRVFLTEVGKEFMNSLQKSSRWTAKAGIEDDLSKRESHGELDHSVLELHRNSNYGSGGNIAPQKPNLSKSGSIMIVDDEQDILLTYELYLREQGFNVYGFSDPRDALEFFEDNADRSIDLVISDIRMMSINGIQLYRQIKSIDPDVKIIFISALDAAPELGSVIAGFNMEDLLLKPVDQTRLLNTVSMALAKARSSDGAAMTSNKLHT